MNINRDNSVNRMRRNRVGTKQEHLWNWKVESVT